jgi:hypothetical protein
MATVAKFQNRWQSFGHNNFFLLVSVYPLAILLEQVCTVSQKVDFLWNFNITVAVVQQRTGEMIKTGQQDLAVNHTFVMS